MTQTDVIPVRNKILDERGWWVKKVGRPMVMIPKIHQITCVPRIKFQKRRSIHNLFRHVCHKIERCTRVDGRATSDRWLSCNAILVSILNLTVQPVFPLPRALYETVDKYLLLDQKEWRRRRHVLSNWLLSVW